MKLPSDVSNGLNDGGMLCNGNYQHSKNNIIKANCEKKGIKRSSFHSGEIVDELKGGPNDKKRRVNRVGLTDGYGECHLHSSGLNPGSWSNSGKEEFLKDSVEIFCKDLITKIDNDTVVKPAHEIRNIGINRTEDDIDTRFNSKRVDENINFKVRPSQERTPSSLRRCSRKRKRGKSSNSSNQGWSSALPSMNSSLITEKSEAYQSINKDCYVAVDCEMVGIVGGYKNRSALGRCSIVDYNGEILYDKYIKSKYQIIDFRTPYSGITPEHMETAEPIDKALQDIHSCLKNKIIIAHDIYNDLNAMHFIPHRYLMRDTSRCHMLSFLARQNGHMGRENELMCLKSLAKTVLGIDIQIGNKGHNSVEDARTAMELFKRVRNGWEKMLFAKWSREEGLNVAELVNGLNNKEDIVDGERVPITDFHSSDDNNLPDQDYLSDDFWPAV